MVVLWILAAMVLLDASLQERLVRSAHPAGTVTPQVRFNAGARCAPYKPVLRWCILAVVGSAHPTRTGGMVWEFGMGLSCLNSVTRLTLVEEYAIIMKLHNL